ncbi:SDR family NAD(P)-dependent oxidoreductase [Nostoc sp. DSM 114167]|uniref:SDR family NAD(P)-dependent oxidoreductase n=1 Tax=Nostoc sp. DSM 114167 TaxID=3439050 RepID=UPI0040451CE3
MLTLVLAGDVRLQLGVAPYCASKWAIEGLTRSLAQELPNGMAAIPLNPGIIHTDMLSISFGEEAANYTLKLKCIR